MFRISLVVAAGVTVLGTLTPLAVTSAEATAASTLTIAGASWHLDEYRNPAIVAQVSGSSAVPAATTSHGVTWEIFATRAGTACPATEPLDPQYGNAYPLPGFADLGGDVEADGASTFTGTINSELISFEGDASPDVTPATPIVLCGYVKEWTTIATADNPYGGAVYAVTASTTAAVAPHVMHMAYRNVVRLRSTYVESDLTCYDLWGDIAVGVAPCATSGTLVVRVTRAVATKLKLASTIIVRGPLPVKTTSYEASNNYASTAKYKVPAPVAKKLANKTAHMIATTTLTAPTQVTMSGPDALPGWECYATTTTPHLCAG